ncbi:MAG: hypothetical protein ACKOFI_11385, partial [Phycisphaerales bacterium]
MSLETNASDAANVASGARLSVAVLRTAGSIDGQSEERVDGAIEAGATIPDDPLEAVTVPAIDGSAAKAIAVDPGGDTSVAPGVHEGLFANAGTIVLQPGLHQFTGPVSLQGTAALQLRDATIQLDAGVARALGGRAAVTGPPSGAGPRWGGGVLLSRGGVWWGGWDGAG